MIKLKTLLEISDSHKYFFVGDCRNILSTDELFDSLMDMSYQVDNAKPLRYIEFINKIVENSIPKEYRLFKLELRKNPDNFTFGEGNGFVFAFDGDIHYFFAI